MGMAKRLTPISAMSCNSSVSPTPYMDITTGYSRSIHVSADCGVNIHFMY
jgi:hypothetical protein